ncbi:MAG: hypothetical protein FWD71_16280 [Oscillospiraceae bacterium]|nr:hypothetical protein [Oscillospiraceae bacterium]
MTIYKKFILNILIISTILLYVSSCVNNEAKYLIFPGNFDDVNPASPLSLPYTEDFNNGSFNNVQDFNPGLKWKIVKDKGNKVLKCVAINPAEVPMGMDIFDLMIGDKTWTNYTFSFDCKIAKDSYIYFAPFADTNADNYTDYPPGRNPWSLQLDYEGVLIYQTVFGHDWHYIGEKSDKFDSTGTQKTKPIDGFIADKWNHIELIPVGLDLQMTINGINIGKVAEIHDGESGRVSIGGNVGCMFDNLSIKPAN